jgi:hypothetical protein
MGDFMVWAQKIGPKHLPKYQWKANIKGFQLA